MTVSSMTFDTTYYLTQNPDVLAAILAGTVASAEAHYQQFGFKELRDPNASFDTSYYFTANPDVLAAGVNPLTHFSSFGASENRAPTEALATAGANFNSSAYLTANTDVAAAITANTFTSAYQHWVLFGQFESRAATTNDGTTLTGASTTTTTGSTFTLTTAADNFTGTANNDTFNGGVSATATDNTFGLVDTLNGGAGNDTLNITAAVLATNISVPAASLTSIETVNIKAVDADGTPSTDAAVFASQTGVTAVNASGTSNVTVTNLATGASVGMVGDGATKNGILSYAYATDAAAQTINISGGTLNTGGANITNTGAGGMTAATINSTGAANKVGVIKLDGGAGNTITSLTVNAATNLTATLTANDFAAAAKLTVSGAASSVDLGTVFDGATIDASGLTAGGLTIGLVAGSESFTGGTGNDVITTAAVTKTGTGLFNAGAGTDTLIATAAHVDSSAEAGKYTGFETLRTSGTLDVSFLGSSITALEITTDSALSGMTATQAAAVTVRADAGATSFALATSSGTSDVLTLNMGTGAAGASEATDFTGGVTLNGFETLNIKTNQGTTATTEALKTTEVSAITADKLTAINLTGHSVTLANAATTLATTIDGSALTGVLTVAGNLIAGSTVTGGAGNDLFTAGTNNGVTYTGGAGNDQLSATVAQLTATGTNDTKFVGGDGTDTLKVTDTAATVTDNQFTNVSGAEKITVDATGATSFTTGSGFNTAFSSGVTITQAGHATDASAVTYAMGLSNVATTLSVTTDNLGQTTEDVTITTGSGADTVTFAGAAWVGVAGADGGQFVISTGAGDDTISITHSTLISNNTSITGNVTAGAGADTITKVGTNDDSAFGVTHFNIAAGDSTATAFDKITGFDVANTTFSDGLNFDGAAAIATVGTSTNFGTILSSSTTAGIVQFDDAEAFAAAIIINSSNLADAVGYLAANTATNDTAAFVYDSTGNGAADSTMVYHNGATDSLVQLTGLTGVDALITTNGAGANDLFIL